MMLPYLTDADVDFMRNPRRLREPSSEDAFMDLYSEVDRWIESLRSVAGVGFSPRVISDLRQLSKTAYAELDRVGIQIEADPQADWSPEAIESCVGQPT